MAKSKQQKAIEKIANKYGVSTTLIDYIDENKKRDAILQNSITNTPAYNANAVSTYQPVPIQPVQAAPIQPVLNQPLSPTQSRYNAQVLAQPSLTQTRHQAQPAIQPVQYTPYEIERNKITDPNVSRLAEERATQYAIKASTPTAESKARIESLRQKQTKLKEAIAVLGDASVDDMGQPTSAYIQLRTELDNVNQQLWNDPTYQPEKSSFQKAKEWAMENVPGFKEAQAKQKQQEVLGNKIRQEKIRSYYNGNQNAWDDITEAYTASLQNGVDNALTGIGRAGSDFAALGRGDDPNKVWDLNKPQNAATAMNTAQLQNIVNKPENARGTLRGTAVELAQSAGTNTPGYMAALINPVASAAVLGTQMAGSSYNEARDAGHSVGKSFAFATEQGLEEFVTDRIIGIAGGALGKGAIANTQLAKTVGESVKSLGKTAVGKTVASVVSQMVSNGMGEFAQEFLQYYTENAAREVFLGEKAFKGDSKKDLKEALHAGLIGFLNAVVMGAAPTAANIVDTKVQGGNSDIRIDSIEAIKKELDTDRSHYSPEEYYKVKNLSDLLDEAINTYKSGKELSDFQKGTLEQAMNAVGTIETYDRSYENELPQEEPQAEPAVPKLKIPTAEAPTQPQTNSATPTVETMPETVEAPTEPSVKPLAKPMEATEAKVDVATQKQTQYNAIIEAAKNDTEDNITIYDAFDNATMLTEEEKEAAFQEGMQAKYQQSLAAETTTEIKPLAKPEETQPVQTATSEPVKTLPKVSDLENAAQQKKNEKRIAEVAESANEYSNDVAEIYKANYDPKMQPSVYKSGFYTAYNAGKEAVPMDEINSLSYNALSDEQKKAAYDAGYNDRDVVLDADTEADGTETQTKINRSMSMDRAREMVKRAFVVGGIREWFEGEYKTPDEWLEGEGSSSVAIVIDNDYSMQSQFLNKIPGILNDEFTTEDILDAYKAKTLTGAEKQALPKADLSKGVKVSDRRFYAPRMVEDAKAKWDLANRKATGADKESVYQARADVLMYAHNKGAAETLGITEAELNKKLRSWGRYSAKAREISTRINSNVADSNKWSGIENVSYINSATVTKDDVARMVKEVKGNGSDWQYRYIARTMLGIDTHMDWSWLSFTFTGKQGRTANGDYLRDHINIYSGGANTVAHEMGHALDEHWAKDLGIGGFLSQAAGTQKYNELNAEQKAFFDRFQDFMDSILSVGSTSSEYAGRATETFARFVSKFVGWTENISTGNSYNYEESYYNDRFTQAQYVQFAKLLQEKAMLDSAAIGSKQEDRFSYESLSQKDDMVISRVDANDGEMDRSDAKNKAQMNVRSVSQTGDNRIFVEDLDKEVIFGNGGIKHSLNRGNDPLKVVLPKIGEILKNSVLINEASPRGNEVGSYILLGMGYDGKDYYPTIFTVKRNVNSLDVERVEVLNVSATNTKKAETSAQSSSIFGVGSPYLDKSGLSKLNIIDVLKIVKSTDSDILPLSVAKHFDYERPEGRFKGSLLHDITPEQLANLENLEKSNTNVKYINDVFNETVGEIAGHEAKAGSANRAVASAIKAYESTADKAELSETLSMVYDYLGTQSKADEREVYAVVHGIAQEIVDNAQTKTSELEDMYPDLKKELRSAKIEVSDTIKNSIADWNDFRKSNMGSLTFVNKGNGDMEADSFYEQLSEEYPELFPAEIVNDTDRLLRIAEVAQDLKPTYEAGLVYNGEAKSKEELDNEVAALTTKLLQGYFGGKGTSAYEQKLENRIKNMQSSFEKTLAAKDERFAQYKENQRTRAKTREAMNDLLKKARKLSTMKGDAEFRAEVDKLIGNLDLVAPGIRKDTEQKLVDLQKQVMEQAANDPDYGDLVAPKYNELFTRISKKHISDMSIEEIIELTQQIVELEHSKRTYDREIKEAQGELFAEQGRRGVAQQEKVKGINVRSAILETLGNYKLNMLNPVRAMSLLDGYQDNGIFTHYAKELNDGQTKAAAFVMETEKMFQEINNDKELINDFSKPVIDIGNGQKISKGMRISLYLASKNRQNLEHMAYGGIKIPDHQLYEKGKYAEAYSMGRRIKLSPSQVRAITSKMTEGEKRYADIAYKFFNEKSKKAINETSLLLNGYEKAVVSSYFPIKTDNNFTRKEMSGLIQDATIEGWGSLKERQESAKNPIMLEDVSQVVLRQMQNTSRYYGLAIPVRNFNRFWNYESTGYDTSMKEAFDQNWHGAGEKYIQNVISDIQTGGRNSERDILSKAKSLYAGATLNLNLGVAIKQSSSYPFAASVIGWAPILKNAGRAFSKADYEYMDSITPWGYMRRQGMSGTEMGEVAKQRTTVQNSAAFQKLKQKADWIRRVDVKTTDTLFFASEDYVKQRYPEFEVRGEEYNQKVAEVYNDVLQRTQPSYDIMQRPEFLRSESPITQVLGMFKTQTFNMGGELIDAYSKWNAYKEYAKNDSSYKAKERQAGKEFGRTVGATIASQAMLAILTVAANAVLHKMKPYRDEETGEITAESFIDKLGSDFLKSFAGMTLGGSEIQDAILAISGRSQWYDITFPGLDSVNDFVESLKKWRGSLESLIEAKTPEAALKATQQSVNMLKNAALLKGIPANNIYNIVNAAWLWGQDFRNKELGSFEAGEGILGLTNTSPTAKQYANRTVNDFSSGNNSKGETSYKKLAKAKGDEKKADDALNDIFKDNPDKAQAVYDNGSGHVKELAATSLWKADIEADGATGDAVYDYVVDMVKSGDYTESDAVAWYESDTQRAESKKYVQWKDKGYDPYEYIKYRSIFDNYSGDTKKADIVEFIKGETEDIQKRKAMYEAAGYSLDKTKDGKVSEVDGNFNEAFYGKKTTKKTTTKKTSVPKLKKPEEPETQPVSYQKIEGSSNLSGVSYNPNSEVLTVDFTNGHRYTYDGVSQDTYDDFMDADSKGSYFNKYIKNGDYDYTKISRKEPVKKLKIPTAIG